MLDRPGMAVDQCDDPQTAGVVLALVETQHEAPVDAAGLAAE